MAKFFRISLLLSALSLPFALSAQDDEFDLSSQRSESQFVNPVPGNKVDHNGWSSILHHMRWKFLRPRC